MSGTAHHSEPAQGAHSPTLTMGATQAGVILGTAAYMAPEQIKGKEAERRADIWAFGVVFYELLTGDRPFKGKDSTEIMAHAVTSDPSLGKAPSRVRRLLTECLKKEPEEGLRWVGDVARFLEQPAEGRGPAATEVHVLGSSRVQKLLWPVMAAVGVVIAAGLPSSISGNSRIGTRCVTPSKLPRIPFFVPPSMERRSPQTGGC